MTDSIAVMEQAYAEDPHYYELERIRQLLVEGAPAEQPELLELLSRVPAGSYLRLVKDDYAPIVYALLMQEKDYRPVVNLLLKRGADPTLPSRGRRPMSILVRCQLKYLDYLCTYGAQLLNPVTEITYLIRQGGQPRLAGLYRQGRITDKLIEQVAQQLPELRYRTVQALRDYATYLFVSKPETERSPTAVAAVIDRYRATLDWLREVGWPNGTATDLPFWQFCIDYYLYELLETDQLVVRRQLEKGALTEPQYHEYRANSQEVAILRPWLNDRRYQQTCQLLRIGPDPALFYRFSDDPPAI
jgi:hypothetical protein